MGGQDLGHQGASEPQDDLGEGTAATPAAQSPEKSKASVQTLQENLGAPQENLGDNKPEKLPETLVDIDTPLVSVEQEENASMATASTEGGNPGEGSGEKEISDALAVSEGDEDGTLVALGAQFILCKCCGEEQPIKGSKLLSRRDGTFQCAKCLRVDLVLYRRLQTKEFLNRLAAPQQAMFYKSAHGQTPETIKAAAVTKYEEEKQRRGHGPKVANSCHWGCGPLNVGMWATSKSTASLKMCSSEQWVDGATACRSSRRCA